MIQTPFKSLKSLLIPEKWLTLLAIGGKKPKVSNQICTACKSHYVYEDGHCLNVICKNYVSTDICDHLPKKYVVPTPGGVDRTLVPALADTL